MRKKMLLGLLLLVMIAQFFQPSRNMGTAEGSMDITHAVTVPDSIRSILRAACYDCHSNKTSYPWYSRITPVNWWLADHVEEGKKQLNFSSFASYAPEDQHHGLEEIAETVKEHAMPLDSYLWMHKEARLNDAQRKAITDWAILSRRQVLKGSPQVPQVPVAVQGD